MTQKPRKIRQMTRDRRSLLLQRLGLCLGGVSMFGSTVAQAQTVTTLTIPVSESAPQSAPAPAKSARSIAEPTPEVSLAPAAPVPTRSPEVAPPIKIESPAVVPSSRAKQSANSEATDYAAPAAIIFSDRSSGCETSLKWGQTAGSICGGSAPSSSRSPIARSDRPSGSSYSNAARYVSAPETVSAAPVRLGPISLGSAGIQITPPDLKPYVSPALKRDNLPSIHSLGLIFPLAIPAPITSLFGWRIHPITGEQRIHTGTDLGAPLGTPVLAALTGRVLLADLLGGYGLTVALEHNQGVQQTLYGHLSEIFVKPGEVVQQGTVIGLVGSTGNSTGPHLHFELRQQTEDGSWVAQDAGQELEFAMAQLVKSLQLAQKPQQLAQAPNVSQPNSASQAQVSTPTPTNPATK